MRVNDVDLAEQRTNGTVELRITDVDVGLTGATRRLLQGLASPSLIRRIQDKLPARVIRWEFVNLIEPDPLRRVKLRITHQKLEKMHPADLADIMEDLSPAERQAIIASLDEQIGRRSAGGTGFAPDVADRGKARARRRPPTSSRRWSRTRPPTCSRGLSPEVSQDVLEEMPGEEAREVAGAAEIRRETPPAA